jgi:hypothetical protein
MAEAVAKGAKAASGGEVRLLSVDETSSDDLLWADAVMVSWWVRPCTLRT